MTDIQVDAPGRERRRSAPTRYDEQHQILWLGSTPIPFRPGHHDNGFLVTAVAACIRDLRGVDASDPCPLRRSDLRTLGRLLDLDDPGLRSLLRSELALTRRQAGDTVDELRRARNVSILVDDELAIP